MPYIKHKEAFCLMNYADKEGTQHELLWNTRDGVTPFGMLSKDKEVTLFHEKWDQDLAIPYFVPPVGMRVFTDSKRGEDPSVRTITPEDHSAIMAALENHIRSYRAMSMIQIWEKTLKDIFAHG